MHSPITLARTEFYDPAFFAPLSNRATSEVDAAIAAFSEAISDLKHLCLPSASPLAAERLARAEKRISEKLEVDRASVLPAALAAAQDAQTNLIGTLREFDAVVRTVTQPSWQDTGRVIDEILAA